MNNVILDINNLSFKYLNPNLDSRDRWIPIFNNVDISINEGEIVGIAGKSGCGKTTLAKAIVNYFVLSGYKSKKDYQIDGEIIFYQNSVPYSIDSKEYQKFNPPPIQMVFQDPRTSLNMKMSLYEQLKESVKLNKNILKEDMKETIYSIAERYKIIEHLKSNPQNLSGGQRRRFGLAKIVCSHPKIIIADEPVSSLDVSIKQDIMNELFTLTENKITIVIISHDISLLKNNATSIYVMDSGKIVENWNPKNKPKSKETIKLNEDSIYVNQFIKEFNL